MSELEQTLDSTIFTLLSKATPFKEINLAYNLNIPRTDERNVLLT